MVTVSMPGLFIGFFKTPMLSQNRMVEQSRVAPPGFSAVLAASRRPGGWRGAEREGVEGAALGHLKILRHQNIKIRKY